MITHQKGSADHQKSLGSKDIQRMFILLTFESNARIHLVTETLGDTSPLNITELLLYLDWTQYLTLQAEWQGRLTLKGSSRPHVSTVPRLTYLSG